MKLDMFNGYVDGIMQFMSSWCHVFSIFHWSVFMFLFCLLISIDWYVFENVRVSKCKCDIEIVTTTLRRERERETDCLEKQR